MYGSNFGKGFGETRRKYNNGFDESMKYSDGPTIKSSCKAYSKLTPYIMFGRGTTIGVSPKLQSMK
eukprot:CAMPEP_0177565618 /NCGR_PEP_ID=MMETSP0369-20130122/74237_1 /TAXON_ID=447022 ORGANISM="Scrippsiella hangoei-like, Strain SHHI-4" /NCGR_SAMPLE_ID=MMETSP0369 /ASSEMBLY_ACC=CAM_ASM_000364 /LENGTH=65 /DNA_ID=CAMNT_0019052969 /DNA_START=56 /DNA_END=253 /DNA_ORIENTATION=-